MRIGGRLDWLEQTTDDELRLTTTKQKERHFSPQLGVVYQVGESWSLYSTYGEGYRLNFGTDFENNGFEPNQSQSIEFGSKWSILDGLDITLSIFDSKQENIIVADTAHLGFNLAIGEASSKGIEIDLQGHLNANSQIVFSYTYLDAQVEKDSIDSGLFTAIRKGDDLLNIPKHSANLQVSQQHLIFERVLNIGAGMQFVGERLGQRGADFYLPSYVISNAFAEYEVNEKVKTKLQVHNLFDKQYFTNSYTQLWVQPGEPRRIQVSVSYEF